MLTQTVIKQLAEKGTDRDVLIRILQEIFELQSTLHRIENNLAQH